MSRPSTPVFVILCLAHAGVALGSDVQDPRSRFLDVSASASTPGGLARAIGDTTTFAFFDFDDGAGGPDPQGWTTRDRYTQFGTFFHVDDFAGLDGYAALSGNRSMWCGTRDGVEGLWSGRGYGNWWHQALVSRAFAAEGTATISFALKFDVERSYDVLHLEYRQAVTRDWVALRTFDQPESTQVSESILASDYGDSLELRLRFVSDFFGSDETGEQSYEGPVIVDDLVVGSAAGMHDDENFETTPVGALGTADGDWTAVALGGRGDFGALVAGDDVVQEGAVENSTWFWSFFDGSPDDYGCGGFPEQTAVPVPFDPSSRDPDNHIDSEAVSPWIDISTGVEGQAYTRTPDYYVVADVYLDLPLSDGMFMALRVRWMVDGEPTPWVANPSAYGDDPVGWAQRSFSLESAHVAGATHMQVSVGAWYGGSVFGFLHDGCSSHSPLIDDVRVIHVLESHFTVTTTDPSGPGSWAAVVDSVEQYPNPDTILFDVPGPGPHTLDFVFGSQTFNQPVAIHGESQGGASANTNPIDQPSNAELRIIIPGDIRFEGGDSVLSGVVMPTGTLYLASDGNRVENCHIGTDGAGAALTASPNDASITITGDRNTIGGTSAVQRNVLGIGRSGIVLAGDENVVTGNYVGVTSGGTSALATDLSRAVWILGRGNRVGGSQSSQRNVLFGRDRIVEINAEQADGNRVVGNYIGVDRTGLAVVPSASRPVVGIALTDADENEIGGLAAGERNVVAGPNTGAWIFGNAADNLIRNNAFGTDEAANTVLGLGFNGIALDPQENGNVVGGAEAAAGNVIAGAEQAGIAVYGGTTRLSRNAIFDNGGLGIDLGDDGVTANDFFDTDVGANGLQNHPQLNGAVRQAQVVTVTGSLQTAFFKSYTLEFFASESCDPSGYGEGRIYLDSYSTAVSSGSSISFTVDLPATIPDGWFVTATATDLAGNTSEFSPCIQTTNTSAGTDVVVEPFDPVTQSFPLQVTFDEVLSRGNTFVTTGTAGPDPPQGFLLAGVYHDLTTDVDYAGGIEICIAYAESTLTEPETDLALFHFDETPVPAQWIDITTAVDTDADVICGQTTTLSPFALMSPDLVTDVPSRPVPERLALLPNVPNPFNPRTVVRFDVPVGGDDVRLEIYDVAGRRVRRLHAGVLAAGRHVLTWDGKDDARRSVASGVYLVELRAGGESLTRKVMLLK